MTLSVSATGVEYLTYKWKKDGEDITDPKYSGIDTSTLTIEKFLEDDQGTYYVVIKNSHSPIESEQANLALGM